MSRLICNLFYLFFYIAIPSDITDLANTSVTYHSVSLSWSVPSDTGGYNTVNYVITVTPLDGSDPWNIPTTDNSTSYIITGLIMFGQSYNFTVRANNNIGLGEESNMVTVTTNTIGICCLNVVI